MKWSEVERSWPAFTDAIAARWPEIDADEVADLGGDRSAFNAYLGRVCGLTPREAQEQIDEWLAGPLPLDAVTSEHHDDESIRASGRHIPPGEDVYSGDADFGDDRLVEPPMGRD